MQSYVCQHRSVDNSGSSKQNWPSGSGDNVSSNSELVTRKLKEIEQQNCALQLSVKEQKQIEDNLKTQLSSANKKLLSAEQRAVSAETRVQQLQTKLQCTEQQLQCDTKNDTMLKLSLLSLTRSLLDSASQHVASVKRECYLVINMFNLSLSQRSSVDSKLVSIDQVHSDYKSRIAELVSLIEHGEIVACINDVLQMKPLTINSPVLLDEASQVGASSVWRKLGKSSATTNTPCSNCNKNKTEISHGHNNNITNVRDARVEAVSCNSSGNTDILSFKDMLSRLETLCGPSVPRSVIISCVLQYRSSRHGSLSSESGETVISRVRDLILSKAGLNGDLKTAAIFNVHHCPICLDDFPHSQAELVSCGHWLHNLCFKRWRREQGENPTCPLCRETLVFEDFPAL